MSFWTQFKLIATGTLLNMILAHLEDAKTSVLLVYTDLSSAFSYIQPHILKSVQYWSLPDMLAERSQRVKVNGVLSDVPFSSTGSPQCPLHSFICLVHLTRAKANMKGVT